MHVRQRRGAHGSSLPRQRGLALIGVMLALIIATIASLFAASEIQRQIQDHSAASTGKYLMQVRDAVVDLQIKHEAWLSNRSGAVPPSGATLAWESVAGAQVARGSVSDLVSLGVLAAELPRYPVLGDAARFILVRQGSCPGEECRTSAYVYTCHPISSQRSLRANTDCTPPSGARAEASQTLLGKVLLATDGYGGHDALAGDNLHGPLMDGVPRAWFDFGTQPGHAVLAAGLNATPFGQFVRHGETRPVSLRNTLTVAGVIQSDAGLLLNTEVMPGAACATPGLYAATANKLLAVCADGVWVATDSHRVTAVLANLPHDAAVPEPVCPAGLTPWRHIALQAIAVTASGGDVNVSGGIGGTVYGSGYVGSGGGTVTINGAFTGSFSNAGSSYVHTAQRVSLAANRVVITPADMNARAALIQGCRG